MLTNAFYFYFLTDPNMSKKISKIQQRVNAAVDKKQEAQEIAKIEKAFKPDNNMWEQMRKDHETIERNIHEMGVKLVNYVTMQIANPEVAANIKDPTALADALTLAGKDIAEQTAITKKIRDTYENKKGSVLTVEDYQQMLILNAELVESTAVFENNFTPTVATIAKELGVVETLVRHALPMTSMEDVRLKDTAPDAAGEVPAATQEPSIDTQALEPLDDSATEPVESAVQESVNDKPQVV